MKVNIIKEHVYYPMGEVDVTEERAHYLILCGIAEEVKEKAKRDEAIPGEDYGRGLELLNLPPEKVEFKKQNEKVEVKKSAEKVTRKK